MNETNPKKQNYTTVLDDYIKSGVFTRENSEKQKFEPKTFSTFFKDKLQEKLENFKDQYKTKQRKNKAAIGIFR